MTNSDPSLNPPTVYVWVWLPNASEPVVAGRLDDRGPVATFAYDICPQLASAERQQLWQRQFLNPFSLSVRGLR